MNVISYLKLWKNTSASCWLNIKCAVRLEYNTKQHKELVASFCFNANSHFCSCFISAQLNQIATGCRILLNPPADRGDSMAASDYKHPRWHCPFPPVFSSAVWGRTGMWGVCSDWDGWLWPWHQFPVLLFPAPPLLLLRGNQTTIAELGPCRLSFYRETRHCGTVRTMGTRPCRRIAAQPLGQAGRAHCSSWVRVLSVWPNTSTEHCWPTLFLKEHRSRVYNVQVKICHCTGLLRNC